MKKTSPLFKKRSPYFYVIASLLILLTVGLDQLTKLLAVKLLGPVLGTSVPLIKGVFHFTYYENPAAAFGILENMPWLFNTVTIITVIGFIAYVYLGHCNGRIYLTASTFIIGGGIGNMIDRLAQGYVVDFFDFCLIDFAIFNVADSFVCIGAFLLALGVILDIIKEEKEKRREGKK